MRYIVKIYEKTIKKKIIILGEDKFVKFMNMKFKDKLEILENKFTESSYKIF